MENLDTQVNEILKSAATDEKGKLILPEDISPELAYAVKAEKRYRDTQAAYTAARQDIAAKEAEKNKLLETITPSLNLSAEQASQLEQLKQEDPEAWRAELNRLEAEASKTFAEELNSKLNEARSAATVEALRKEREKALKEFKEDTGIEMTDEILDKELPQSFVAKLENGMDFRSWLNEAAEYLTANKVISQKAPKNVSNPASFGRNTGRRDVQKESLGDLYSKAVL